MDNPLFRPRTIDEIYFKAPPVIKIVQSATHHAVKLNTGGNINQTPAISFNKPDMSNPVLSNPSRFQEVSKFIYYNRYELLLMAVGTVFLIVAIEELTTEPDEKKALFF